MPTSAWGNNLFVTNNNIQTIGEYTTSGAVVNASLVSGLNYPTRVVVSGSDLFVLEDGNSTIGEYTMSGATVTEVYPVSGLPSTSPLSD